MSPTNPINPLTGYTPYNPYRPHISPKAYDTLNAMAPASLNPKPWILAVEGFWGLGRSGLGLGRKGL